MPRTPPENTLHSREAFFQREAEQWAALNTLWEALPQSAWDQAGVNGDDWTAKDLVNHLAVWQEAALRVIHDLLAGRWARLGPSPERFNQQHYAADRTRPLAASRARLVQARTTLLALLHTLDERQLLDEYGRQHIGWWAKWTTYGHYEQHLEPLRAWVERQRG